MATIVNRNFTPSVKPKRPSFTKDQEAAITNILNFIAKPWDPQSFTHALIGAGGTGKTFTLNYIIHNCAISPSLICCSAPTHKAGRVLSKAINNKEVYTIQSVFGFRLDTNIDNFDPELPSFKPMGRIKINSNDVKVLIIDESSMLNAKLVRYINDKCKALCIKVLYVGDSSQLPPVNEKTSTAFTIVSGISKLVEVVRQEANNPITDLLKIMRADIENGTFNAINEILKGSRSVLDDNRKGVVICGAKEFENNLAAFGDPRFQKDVDMYKIIAYTNNKVSIWNNYIRNNIVIDADKGVIGKHDLLMSYSTIVDNFNSVIIANSEDYIINDIVDFVDNVYGFKSYLVKFQEVHTGRITKPLCIIDHTDKFTIQLYYKTVMGLKDAAQRANKSNRSELWMDYFDFKKKYLIVANILDRQGKLLISKDIDYGFAITAHKSQGSTYNTVFVDANDLLYDKNGNYYPNLKEVMHTLYTACSRASDKLYISIGQ